MAEPGYLHVMKVLFYTPLFIISGTVSSKCFRTKTTDGSFFRRCSCIAGAGGYCHHVIGLLYYLALLKQLRHRTLPNELTCTSMKQCWSIPGGKKIEQKEVQNVLVQKPQLEHFDDPQPRPLFANHVLPQQQLPSIPFIASKFGNDPGGCLLSYQQKMSSYYVINDFTCCH
ncbi:unnamed protein product [Pocillopora meandrina]|uniref:SWIM-type domain-containing protein n=1 Tax=Pocillopora meandrina TaxID=46732 RepID=A0AAU9W7E8_9CNID|nr:unnamed protein product [Pocillopora meandrina]